MTHGPSVRNSIIGGLIIHTSSFLAPSQPSDSPGQFQLSSLPRTCSCSSPLCMPCSVHPSYRGHGIPHGMAWPSSR
ncbi:hypothetical protein CMEL01_05641 [Colletotrichum melonis]|uniref:Uncharacterized protein n=1 Tax=Colletotrichum melonis TaxID=1209925 RepID=A0AAI9UBK4_9PEZI|nr:hypothetical protein CMEL01_05641 [Colletotrichum melonis]